MVIGEKPMEVKKLTVAVLTAATVLSGCAYTPTPLEEYHPLSYQLDMQAAHHWNVLAEKVAATIYANLPKKPQIPTLDTVFQAALPFGTVPAPDLAINAEPIPSSLSNAELPPPVELAQVEPVQLESVPAVAEPVPVQPVSTEPRVIELNFNNPNVGTANTEMKTVQSVQIAAAPPIVSLPPATINQYPATPIAPPPILSATPLSALSIGNEDVAPLPPALYINPPRGGQETPFMMAFHDLLRSHLVQKGIVVSTRPDSVNTFCSDITTCKPMLLDYDLQIVHHKDRRGRRYYGQPATEVVIHTNITDGDLVVFSRSDIYYINTGDDDHYQRRTKTLRVTDR